MPADIVYPDRLVRWCTEHLGSPPAKEIFRSGHLSAVHGLRLADGRAVVVKLRPATPSPAPPSPAPPSPATSSPAPPSPAISRLVGCVAVQRHLFHAGYPCPEPLTGAVPFGTDLATAESYIPDGAKLPSPDRAPELFATAFATLLSLAPRPAEVSALDPAPSWAAWNQPGDGLWPRPEGQDIDLDLAPDAGWIDEAGRWARDRLRTGRSEPVIGHCDWLAGNLQWRGDELLVVHDWDSVIAEDEAVLVGLAAALYSTRDPDELADVADTEQFLRAYGEARGRELSLEESERAWAAGLWTRAYDAKYQHTVGAPVTALSQAEAEERRRRGEPPGR